MHICFQICVPNQLVDFGTLNHVFLKANPVVDTKLPDGRIFLKPKQLAVCSPSNLTSFFFQNDPNGLVIMSMYDSSWWVSPLLPILFHTPPLVARLGFCSV